MRLRLWYGSTIFLSSLLLFLVQPMLAKTLLPWFGGTAGVWTTSLLFFQAMLLVGYAWAHWMERHLPPMAQAALHLTLVAGSIFFLPITPWSGLRPVEQQQPILGILLVLGRSIGVPYLLLCANGPLTQIRYARQAKVLPYRMFAVSNAGAFVALLAYPFAIEPWFTVRHQWMAWSAGYVGFAALTAATARFGAGEASPRAKGANSPGAERLVWIALAACPSILWLATAEELSQNVAPVPFLWIFLLSLYLLSLILCFDHEGCYNPSRFRIALPAAWVLIGYLLFQRGTIASIGWVLLLHSLALFTCCMFCHGELARRKPGAQELTSFYLMLALGGALGGIFVGLAAPLLFDQYLELPVGVALCMILAMALLYGYGPARILRLGLLAMAGLAIAIHVGGKASGTRIRERNFYGALKVTMGGSGESAFQMLSNGPIQHGMQFLSPEKRNLATTYYAPASGVGFAIRALQKGPERVGVIGLGVGTLASYGRPGDVYRFYELNPAVIRIATSDFRYLRDCRSRLEIITGDARVALEHEPPQDFDVLVVDAFSGDSIPVHLLTREAFDLYERNLKRDGILAVNVTNRYLNLSPVVEALAQAIGKHSVVFSNPADPRQGVDASTWVIVTANREAMTAASGGVRSAVSLKRPLWTDDYSNLFQVLR
jgi:hypothetical protein